MNEISDKPQYKLFLKLGLSESVEAWTKTPVVIVLHE